MILISLYIARVRTRTQNLRCIRNRNLVLKEKITSMPTLITTTHLKTLSTSELLFCFCFLIFLRKYSKFVQANAMTLSSNLKGQTICLLEKEVMVGKFQILKLLTSLGRKDIPVCQSLSYEITDSQPYVISSVRDLMQMYILHFIKG